MARTYKTEGIILKRTNFGEADKIITVFTKNHGKLKILAKGVRRITSRRAPHLELFNKVVIFLHEGKNFDLVTEAQIINSYQGVRKDLGKIRAAYFAVELVDSLCPEKQVNRQVFILLENFLNEINKSKLSSYRNLCRRFAGETVLELGYLRREKISPNFDIINFIESIIERKLRTRKLWM